MRKQSGISAINLVLMGGVAALLLDKRLRYRVVGGTREVIDTTQGVIEHEVLPVAATAAKEARRSYNQWQEEGGAEHTIQKAQHLIERLQQEARDGDLADQASHWLDDLTHRLSHFAQGVQSELEDKMSEAEESLEDARKEARQRGRRLAREAESEYGDVQGAFMGFLGRTGDELEDRRRHMERDLKRARRAAEKELRQNKRYWNPDKLEKAIAKKVAPLQKEAEKEFKAFSKDVLKQKRMAAKQARAAERGNGGLVLLGLAAAGGAVLWNSPEARHAMLDGVEKVSPDARHHLERVGRSLRDAVGELWIEAPNKPEASQPRPATKPAAKEQAEPSANEKLGETADPSLSTGNPKTGAPAPGAQADAKSEHADKASKDAASQDKAERKK